MRPFTLVLSAGAMVSLVLLVGFMWKARPPATAEAADETSTEERDAPTPPRERESNGPRPAADRSRVRSVPRLDPTALDPWAPRPGETPEEAKLRKQAHQDGFLFREEGSPAIYVVQNGTRLGIPSWTEFVAMGYKESQVRVVKKGEVAYLRTVPPDRTLMRERNDPAIYMFEGGRKRPIASFEAFERTGNDTAHVRTVARGTLSAFPDGPAIQ